MKHGPRLDARRVMKAILPAAAIFLAVTFTPPATAAPPPPVTSLAYRPTGAHLAAGSRNEVLLFDAAGSVVARVTGQSGPVTALAWNRDGTRLAVASGVAGKSG